MRIKRFTAHSLKEATAQMRKELGTEAIILSTRAIPGQGRLGFHGRDTFEVTAAIDDAPVAPSRKGTPAPFARYMENATPTGEETVAVDELRQLTEKMTGRHREPAAERGIPRQANELAGMLDLRNELEGMRGAIREISEQIRYQRTPEVPEALRQAFATLVENDVDQDLASRLVQTVSSELGRDGRDNRRRMEELLLQAMAGLVKTPDTGKSRRRRTKIITLVGPTGVGKTTTIAKLAAIHKLVYHKNVALISTDTYRIGAIEQLKTFAAIADIPMQVVYRPAEMASALRRFRDKDYVFIDTVGRSHRSKKEIGELSRFVEAADPDETHLVLSASTAIKTSLDIITRFKPLKPNRLIFTKLDEAISLGALLSIITKQQLPLSFVTTGQNVPDDIQLVEPSHFASMVYSGVVANA